MEGLTFDTGALLGLIARRHRMRKVYDTAVTRGWPMTVPVAVVTEGWRGPNPRYDEVLRVLHVEDMGIVLAKLTGEALAAVPSATTVDAIVMASAALRGDGVYTSDVGDLSRLQRVFPNVRIFQV